LRLPDPLLQLGFATLLDSARERYLLDALREVVADLPVSDIDRELAAIVSPDALARLAGAGVRGETYFPVPLVLRQRPLLLGYYRLLYGFSQKQFYKSGSGCSIFREMEVSARLTARAEAGLPDLCRAFADVGVLLVKGLGTGLRRSDYSSDLCMLTLGAQYRGSANNARGSDGIKAVFAVLKAIFEAETVSSDPKRLAIINAAGREVSVKLAADPDIMITARMADGNERSVVAIEVKAGEDHSNIWNRVGEAEKSHLKAKERGVAECWTIINDLQASPDGLRTASPSTNRFYQLLDLTNDQAEGRIDFAARVRDMVGL
jgi:hypothetical protein